MIEPPSDRRFLPGSGETPGRLDDSFDAVAYRAREAYEATLAHTKALDALTTAVGGLTGSISTLSKLVRWVGAIAGAVIVATATGWGLTIAGRIRLDPPAAQLAPPRAP